MSEIFEEAIEFIKEAFGSDSVSLRGPYDLPSGISLQTQATVEAYSVLLLGNVVVLAVITGSPKGGQILSLAEELKTFPAPVVLVFHSVDKEIPGLLVTRDIAHIIPGHRLFAPVLGLLYKALPQRRERWRERNAARLSATGLQILSCVLLVHGEPWEQPWKSIDLRQVLQKHLPGAGLSPANHSRILAELADLGFVEGEGGGPWKRFTFLNRDELWARLLRSQVETVVVRSRIRELPQNPIFAGNQALARLSRLRLTENDPIEIAMSQKDFDALPREDGRTLTNHILVQIWRNRPALVIEKGGERCINVIDLALSKRATSDPRECEVIADLLEQYKLSPSIFLEAS